MTTNAPLPVTTGPTNAAGGVTAAPFTSASLYVGDLAVDVSEALLFEIFNAVGPVASVRVCRDASTRRSLGYAYVNFHRVDDAERALDTMNFKNIRNRPCRIMWSHRDPSLRRSGLGNIFVNHLAKSIDNKQLYDTFSMFGSILSCKVAMNGARESLGYGFVHYENDEAAQIAITRVDGKIIAGEKVSVSMFKSKRERGGANKYRYTNVFVKNLPAEMSKETLESIFAKHGTITSCVIATDKDTKSRAFGFVNFAAPEEATAAVDALNNSEHDGKKLYVSRAQKREEREKELRERFESLKLERQKKYAGVNLYVKNLSDECDDARLTTEFSKYGQITSCKIMRDSANKSRGFGFVCFSSPDEATKAVTEMNGRMMDGKPLYVSLAQRKEIRRQQLEAQYAQRMKMGGGMGVGGAGMGGVGGAGMGGYGGMNGVPQSMMFAGGLPGQQRMMGYPVGAGGVMGGMVGGMNRWPGAAPMGMGMRGNVNQASMQAQMGMYNGIMQGNQRPMMGAPPGVQQNSQIGGMNQSMVGGMGVGGVGGRVAPSNRQARNQSQPRNGSPTTTTPMGGKGGMPMMGANGMPMMVGQQPQPQLQQQQQQSIRYTDNVRNRAQQPNVPSAGISAPANDVVVMPAPNEPLTIKALAAAPEEMRKQMIGERLFPLIKMQQPQLAGKITGMLLEMDNGELIHLLESSAALQEKITEALQVLHQHPSQDGDAETDEGQ